MIFKIIERKWEGSVHSCVVCNTNWSVSHLNSVLNGKCALCSFSILCEAMTGWYELNCGAIKERKWYNKDDWVIVQILILVVFLKLFGMSCELFFFCSFVCFFYPPKAIQEGIEFRTTRLLTFLSEKLSTINWKKAFSCSDKGPRTVLQ